MLSGHIPRPMLYIIASIMLGLKSGLGRIDIPKISRIENNANKELWEGFKMAYRAAAQLAKNFVPRALRRSVFHQRSGNSKLLVLFFKRQIHISIFEVNPCSINLQTKTGLDSLVMIFSLFSSQNWNFSHHFLVLASYHTAKSDPPLPVPNDDNRNVVKTEWPQDGMELGDYPNLPYISSQRRQFLGWWDRQDRRNYAEPVCIFGGLHNGWIFYIA